MLIKYMAVTYVRWHKHALAFLCLATLLKTVPYFRVEKAESNEPFQKSSALDICHSNVKAQSRKQSFQIHDILIQALR